MIEWTEDLSVGIAGIDEQHKELFNRINALVLAIKQGLCKYTIDDTIRFLGEYAATHFADEERIMSGAGYPDYGQHREEHGIFMKSLDDLKRLAAEPRIQGASYELSVMTNQVVVDWIVLHIRKLDKRLGEFLASGRVETA